jgi:hypothetical protein
MTRDLAISVTYSTIYPRALRRNPMLFGPSIAKSPKAAHRGHAFL